MSAKDYPDIYSGFAENKYDISDMYNENNLMPINPYSSGGDKMLSTSYGKAKTPKLWSRGMGSGGDVRLMTRPSTAIRPVGYTSEAGKIFDNYNSTQKKTVVVENKKEDLPEEKFKNLETKINNILEQSIMLASDPKPDGKTLQKAKELALQASSLDRTLLKMREQNRSKPNLHHNFELTFLVLFNLANIYQMNEMYVESLNTYNLIIKNKMFPNVMRLKMNMGNIYYKMGLYSKAIKMYRMALDQVATNQKELRLKITHNIGILFIKMGQYSDAATSFEFIMSEKCDFKTGLHLILCYYALGDLNELKRSFQMLLDIPIEFDNDKEKLMNLLSNNPNHEYIFDIIKNDELYTYENMKKNFIEKNIIMSSILISSIMINDDEDGSGNGDDYYNWCLDKIKSSNYNKLSFDLELNKSITLLKKNSVEKAIENLKYFEKKEQQLAVSATINLGFIYLLKNDQENYTKYVDQAKTLDTYNPAIYVNAGVAEILNDNLLKAKNYFENALDIDSTSFEALYNLGLIYKKMGAFEQSIIIFRKIQSTIGHELHPQIIYQIANLYESLNDIDGSLDWYLRLLGLVNFDAGIFKKIGSLYEKINERQQAYQYNFESYKIYPVDLEVVDWIGTHFIDLQIAEKAVTFYQKTVIANPDDPYYLIRVANCYRKVGNNQKALQLLQAINKHFPDDLNCLRALIYLANKHGLNKLFEKYTAMYQSIEKSKETRQRVGSSRSALSSSRQKKTNSAKSISSIGEHSNSSGNERSNVEFQENNDYRPSTVAYKDYLGPLSERPMTGMVRQDSEANDIDDDLNPDEMLPI